MANSNGWGDGAANNTIGWGQGANNAIGWGDSHLKSWAGLTDIAGFDSSAISYFNSTGITGATQQDAIDNLVRGLKDDGIWGKMKAIYPFATDNRNAVEYTEDFSNAYWAKVSATVSSNATIAPDGTLTAHLFTTTAAFGRLRTNSGPRNQIATYTFSCYVKGVTGVASVGAIIAGVGVGFTIASNGTITVNAPIGLNSADNLQISNVGNGWYRVSGTRTYTTTADDFQIWSSNSGNSFYVWGAQLEIAPNPTTYQRIATTQQAYISNQFKFNLKDPRDVDAAFRLVFNGGWTHSSTGALPNGTNGYADTKLIPLTALTTTNGHLSIYSRSNTNVGFDMGADISINAVISRFNNLFYANYGSYDANVANTDSRGHFITNRNSATKTTGFKNGSKVIDFTVASNLSSFQIAIGALRNSSSSVVQYSNKEVAFSSIGDGLTDTEAANLYTRVQAFQTALSRQV